MLKSIKIESTVLRLAGLMDCCKLHTAKISAADDPSVSKSVFTIMEKAPTRAFFWLKVPTSAFTFKTLLRHC